MSIKEVAKSVKFWIAFVTACVIALVALGATIDRPAWNSEVAPIKRLAGGNQQMIMQMQVDQLTRSIWKQEDRLKMNPNDDGLQRLRELEEQRKRLEEEKARLLEEQKDEG